LKSWLPETSLALTWVRNSSKAIQLSETSGQYKITEFGVAEVSPQVSVADTINELFSKKNFKDKRVVSAVSGRFVFVRYISMPVMSERGARQRRKYELGKYIPVDGRRGPPRLPEARELAAQEGQEPEMRVLLVAASAPSSTSTSASSKARASSPPSSTSTPSPLGNAYELSGMIQSQAIAAGKLVALVDIGASKTNINIMSDSVSYFTREFLQGRRRHSPTPSPRSSPSRSRKPRLSSGTRGARSRRCRTASRGVVEDICHDINISIDTSRTSTTRRSKRSTSPAAPRARRASRRPSSARLQKPVQKWNPLSSWSSSFPAIPSRNLKIIPPRPRLLWVWLPEFVETER